MLEYAVLINISAFMCLQIRMLSIFTVTDYVSSKFEDKRKERIIDPSSCLLVIMNPRLQSIRAGCSEA